MSARRSFGIQKVASTGMMEESLITHYTDIVIVGAGPGGSTLARLLPPTYRVMVIDKKSEMDTSFRKPCGGLLAPDAQRCIAEIGLHLNKDILVDPQIFSVYTLDLKNKLSRHYQRAYFNMDRHRFDLWSMRQIPASVDVRREATVLHIAYSEKGYIVTFRQGEQTEEVHCKYLVGADGANSIVRRFLYPGHKIRTYLSIQEWYEVDQSGPFYASFFDPENTDCYSWALHKDQFLIYGGAFPQDQALQRFLRQKKKLIALGLPLEHPVKREACLVLRPARLKEVVTGRDNAFLIGEAAGFISPSSLEGISFALNSARLLAEKFPNQPVYAKLKCKLFLKLLKSPFLYHPTLRKWIMKSGLQTIKVR